MLFKIRSVEILDRLCNLDHFCDRQESKDLKTQCQAMLSPASRIVLKWNTQGLHPQYTAKIYTRKTKNIFLVLEYMHGWEVEMLTAASILKWHLLIIAMMYKLRQQNQEQNLNLSTTSNDHW